MLPDRLSTVAWPVLDRNDPLDDRWQERKIRQIEIDLPSPLSRSDREVFLPTELPSLHFFFPLQARPSIPD